MDNPVHGNWSLDGRAFITGNKLGTISLYTHHDEVYRYAATRIQQFFDYEADRQADNPFERLEQRPNLCAYNMAPYEVQPNRYLIRFTDVNGEVSSD